MKKLLIFCGPTATGKTTLGIKLAKKLNGEIISADSRQVYQGMDIGTGKEVNNQINKFQISNQFQMPNDKFQIGHYLIDKVKVWLYDVIEPNQVFSAGEYAKLAWLVIEDIWKQGRLPILVGGTGFYIKGLVDGIETMGIGPDWELRKQFDRWTDGQLSSLLKELDPGKWKGMNESDRKNPRRLVRAIEIALQIPNSKFQIPNKSEILNSKFKTNKILFIGLTASYRILYQRIDKRVDERVKQGVVEEIKRLLEMGYHWENSVLGTTIGYKEFKPYFEEQSDLEKVIQQWKYDEHRYARRQITWFKKDKRIHWFDIAEKGFENKVEELVKKWYDNKIKN